MLLKKLLLILFFAAITFLYGCGDSNISGDEDLSYQIGQMIMIGFRGTELNDTNHIVADITQRHIGGVIIYEYDSPSASRPRNITSPEQLKKLTSDLRELNSDTLLIAIDQEGGMVSRLKERYGFPPTVSAQYLGDLNDPDTTRYWAERTAVQLDSMGININFAPVVDLNVNTACPVIGNIQRSFSANPEVVKTHSSIFIEEHHKLGISCAIKHFPGHGSSKVDSHLGFTDISSTWMFMELQPYLDLINAGLPDLIMTAHIYHSSLDSDYPATLSHNIITNILRNSMKWDGVIISDDMQMGAITNNYGFETAILKAVNAGVDILIFSNNSPNGYNPNIAAEAINAIKNLVRSGAIPVSRIKESYARILKLKNKSRR